MSPEFKPTYLYLKKCSHCDLMYFGKTVQDPYKYKGSGVAWGAPTLELQNFSE